MSGGGWNFLKNTSAAVNFRADGFEQRGAGPTTEGDRSEGGSLGGCYGTCDGIMSNDEGANPDFFGYNKVFIPIGDRTSFTADRWGGNPLYRGKRILDSAIADMSARYNLSLATHVVLTGGSSGGLATYLNCDRVAAMLSSTTSYACLADAGYFMDHTTMTGAQSAVSQDFRESYYAWNSSAGTNQACVAHYAPLGTPELCIFAQYVLPFIQSRFFIMQNLYDSWQLHNIYGWHCASYNTDLSKCDAEDMAALNKYGADMRVLLADAVAAPVTGMYATSCIAHCQSIENEHPEALWHWEGRWGIEGKSAALPVTAVQYPRETFGAWFFGRSPQYTVEQRCDWGPACNAMCPDFT